MRCEVDYLELRTALLLQAHRRLGHGDVMAIQLSRKRYSCGGVLIGRTACRNSESGIAVIFHLLFDIRPQRDIHP
jgi:hypothetical protein